MKKLILITLFVMGVFAASANESPKNGEIKIKQSSETLDSLLSVWYKNNIVESYDTFVNDFIDVEFESGYSAADALPDSVYAARLAMLATVIQLPYNPVVKNYILLYTSRKSSMMRRLLGLAQYYMPIFEQELDINGMPTELKVLPIIESALNPKALSRVGAGGLWQFMLRTGKYYGLESNSFVDDRFDPVLSTKAACRYLKDLYAIYGDWTLVIAAYNCGPGNVNKAIKRAGNARTYWDIYEYLPRETRGYIPAFIAATYAYTFHKAHDIEPVSPPHPIVTDTIQIDKMLHFEQISTSIDIPIEVLRNLNPQYKIDIIPAKEKKYNLVLPISDVSNFIENERQIYAKDTLYLASYINSDDINSIATAAVNAAPPSKATKTTSSSSSAATKSYKVRSGDNLGSIAQKNGVTTKQLMTWNKITDPRKLKVGQTIIVKK